MKQINFTILLSTLLILNKGYSLEKMNKTSYSYGSQKYGKETVDSVNGNGSVILEGTKVLGLVSVNGSLNANESAIANLQINGQVDLKNCVIFSNAVINGSLSADNTQFQKELSIACEKFTLRTCSLDSLTVREIIGYNGLQIVDLRSGTKISGPIVVESGNGEIWLSSNSEISNQVIGAKVVRK